MHWGIRWAIVQRMLIDVPSYQSKEKKAGKRVTELTDENFEDEMKRIAAQYQ